MTAVLPSWMTETGPLPILERPAMQQPRDAAGRFASYAELPEPRPRFTVRRFHPDVSTSVVASCCPECVYGDQA